MIFQNVLARLKGLALSFGMPPHSAYLSSCQCPGDMVTPNFRPWVVDEDIEAQFQDEFTHGAPPACTTERQRMDFLDKQCAGKLRWASIRLFLIHVADKSYGDSAELWLMYLSENEKHGREISERWEGDRDDVLVFVSPGINLFFSPVSSPLCRPASSRLQLRFSSWKATNYYHPI